MKEALKGPHAKVVSQLLSDFKKSEALQDWNECGKKLSALEGLMAPEVEVTTSEWVKGFDRKQFNKTKRIAAGGFGEAWVLDPKEGTNGPRLCGKNLLPKHAGKDYLEKEASIYTRAGDHPNIPKCAGIEVIDGKKTLLLEMVDGEDLAISIMDLQGRCRTGQISLEEYYGAVQYSIKKTLQTIAHLEGKGLVHSDLKPQNIMIDRTGEVMVIDLGGAVDIGSQMEVKSLGFASENEEEQANMGSVFDVYSTGKIAQEGIDVESSLNTRFAEFLKDLTNPDPKQRPSAAQALTYPFLSDSLLDEEQARRVLGGNVAVPEPKIQVALDPQAWERAIGLLIEKQQFKVGPLAVMKPAKEVQRHIETLLKNRNYSREYDWKKKVAAIETIEKTCAAIEQVIASLKTLVLKGCTHDYLIGMDSAVGTFREQAVEEKKLGQPETTEKNFAAKWDLIQKELEQEWGDVKEELWGNAKHVADQDRTEQDAEKTDEQLALKILERWGLEGVETPEACCRFAQCKFSEALQEFDSALESNPQGLQGKAAMAVDAGNQCDERLERVEVKLVDYSEIVSKHRIRLKHLLQSVFRVMNQEK